MRWVTCQSNRPKFAALVDRRDHSARQAPASHAYSSSLFAALAGGMRTPIGLGVFDRPDRSVGVWMEDLRHGVPAASWTLQQYRLAAEALGRAQGGSLTVTARATQPWLIRDWLRRFVERRGEFLGALASPGWDHPMVREYLPPDTADRATDIWDSRETLLAMVGEMPAVLTHNDLHPGNLFAVGSSTVLIDWGFVSIGGMGEDPGNLVFDAVLDFFVAPETFPALDQAVTADYLKGAAATVPGIDVGAVQKAIWATGAVRYFWIPFAMVEAASEGRPTLNRRAIGDAFPAWATLVPHIFEFASRARSA
jgi:Phosphotransferase enzyme family